MHEVRKWGNSGGVLLPREWLGKCVKIELVRTRQDIKKEILEILAPYLEDVIGIYLVGSYARNEETLHSDIDVLCISNTHAKKIVQGSYHIEIHSLASVKSMLKRDSISIYPRLYEAKALLNAILLEDLKKIRITAASRLPYIEACKRIVKINEAFIKLEKDEGKTETSPQGIIYSSMLRLRGIYMIKMIEQDQSYSNETFKSWLIERTRLSQGEIQKLYEHYRKERDGEKITDKIPLSHAEKMLTLLKSEIGQHNKKEKAARKRN